MAKPMVNPQQQYLRTQIETASQPQLLLMLFDGAVRKLNVAKKAMEKKNVETAHNELTKVQKIFTELMVALDVEMGGEMADNLLRVYDFIYHHLVRANIKQDVNLVDEVLPIVENLRDGWSQAVEIYSQEAEGGVATAQPKTPNTTDKFSTSNLALKEAAAQKENQQPQTGAKNGESDQQAPVQNPQPNSAKPQPVKAFPNHPARKTGTYGAYASTPANTDQPKERPRLNVRG